MLGIIVATFIGIIIGFVFAALLGANGRDYDQEICQAYSDGFAAGQAKLGATLGERVRVLDTETEG